MMCLDDATVLGLVEGRLAGATLADVDEHLDSCASCRDVVTLVAGSSGTARVLVRGDTVGRYVIGDMLGAGAMGRVYSAWEPELDRRVAIKVLIDDGGTARDRLVREAQAMAKLSHPNVVTVHEVGTTDAGVFVAMELVDGESLRAWVAEPRPWREVVRVLVEISRGLHAVHTAGVVHRDLKPDNVIVGSDGRVRLGDFGLAHAGTKPSLPVVAVGTDTTVAGTPAYMAPEVLRGGVATAASDQFSVGVLAYELLAGRRPFTGATWAELLASIERADIPPLRGLPGWLEDTIRRCLAIDPTKRFASMKDVADVLSRHASGGRPARWIAAAVATAAIASTATFIVTRGTSSGPTCSLAESTQLAANIRRSYSFLGEPALAALDRWIHAWGTERVDTCNAAASAPSARIAARERCLDERRDEIVNLVAQLDATSASKTIDALSALPLPVDCRTADTAVETALPLDPARGTAARDARAALPRLRAYVATGNAELALSATKATVLRARESMHAPTLADALLVQADAFRIADRLDDAATTAREAVAEATRGRADAIAARAWLTRIAIAGDRRDLTSADDFGVLAFAAVERAGTPPHLAATLAKLRGLVAYNRGKLDEARTLLTDAQRRFTDLVGPRSLEVAAVESALGSVARAAGALDEAEVHHRKALDIDLALRGPEHRDIARDHHNIAGVLRLRGDLTGALAEYQGALAIEVATQGERSIAAGLTHNSLGLVLMAKNDWPAARTELVLARDILTAANHGDRAFAEHNLGLVAQALGDHQEALARFGAAAAIYRTTIGDAAPSALRLVDDRAISEVALRGRGPAKLPPSKAVPSPLPSRTPVEAPLATLRPPPQVPAPPPPPRPDDELPKKRDVGVYGSSQSW